jgi:hypothetical protein
MPRARLIIVGDRVKFGNAVKLGSSVKFGRVRKTSTALLVVPLASSMFLAGCGGDTKPDASNSNTPNSKPTGVAPSSTSPSPVPTPTSATHPNIPPAARSHNVPGAQAFVRFFYTQVNAAWTKPTSGLLPALSAPGCKSCAALEATAADLVRKGQHYNGPPATILSVDHLGEGSPGHPEILVRLMQEHRSVIDKAGRVVLTDKREPGKFVATLDWSVRGWSVATVKSLA